MGGGDVPGMTLEQAATVVRQVTAMGRSFDGNTGETGVTVSRPVTGRDQLNVETVPRSMQVP